MACIPSPAAPPNRELIRRERRRGQCVGESAPGGLQGLQCGAVFRDSGAVTIGWRRVRGAATGAELQWGFLVSSVDDMHHDACGRGGVGEDGEDGEEGESEGEVQFYDVRSMKAVSAIRR